MNLKDYFSKRAISAGLAAMLASSMITGCKSNDYKHSRKDMNYLNEKAESLILEDLNADEINFLNSYKKSGNKRDYFGNEIYDDLIKKGFGFNPENLSDKQIIFVNRILRETLAPYYRGIIQSQIR